MGKRGPKPTPTAILKARGSWRADKRDTLDAQNTIPVKPPRCPIWLGTKGRQVWRYYAKRLANAGVLTELDRTTLALFCDAVEQYLQARDELDSNYYTNAAGQLKSHPGLKIRNQAWSMVLKAGAELGLSPSARAGLRLNFTGPDEEDISKEKSMAIKLFKPKARDLELRKTRL